MAHRRAAGRVPVLTHVFVAGDPHLASDAVFGVKDSLVVDVADHEPGTAPDGRDGPWSSFPFDIRLEQTP
jgi:hydroxyquinol 1,2-dioxygenase